MKNLIVISLLLLLLPYTANSQSVVSGTVTGNDGELITFASVTLLQPADSLVVNFASTNNKGEYSITHKPGEYILQVNSLGYFSATKNIDLREKQKTIVDFVLNESDLPLEAVVVSGRDPGIRFGQDTIRYNPKVFTDGTEVVLADVLNKLPGIEVDAKGRVKAQGKQVESILLNGQDFFSGDTQMATQNLPADVAEEVEVLNNYSEYSLLKGFQSHEKTVINVGVSHARLGKISGNLSAAAGYKDKYLGRTSIMQINPKLMTSLIGAINNTGDAVFSMEDYIGMQGGMNEMMDEDGSGRINISLSQEEQTLLIPQNNTFHRKNGLGALNLAYQPAQSLKTTAYILFNDINEKAQDTNHYTYLLPGNNIETTNRLSSQTGNMLFSGLVKLNYQPETSFNLSYKGSISNLDMDRNGYAEDTGNAYTISSLGFNHAQTLKTRHEILMMHSLGKHVLSANLLFAYSDKPSVYDMKTDSLLLPIPLFPEDDWYYARQNTTTEEINTGINVSFRYRINPAYFVKANLNARLSRDIYRSDIRQTNPSDTAYKPEIDSLQNNIRMHTDDYNASIGLTKNTGLFRFKLSIAAHRYKFNNSRLGIDYKTRLNPSAEVSLFFSQKQVLSVSFSGSDSPIPASAFLNGIVFGSYQSFSHNSLVEHLYDSRYTANLSYRFFDLFSNTTLILTGNYQRLENTSTSNYFQNGLLTELQPATASPNTTFHFHLYLNKGLGFIPWTAILNAGYGSASFSNKAMGTDNDIRIESCNGKLQLESNYRRLLNFECSASLERTKNKSSLGSGHNQTVQRYAAKVKLNADKRLVAYAGLEYIVNNAPAYKQNLYSLNAGIRYVLNKHIELEIAGQNMLHPDKQDWISTSYNGVYMAERYFRQIPGNIMGKINYTF